MSLNLYLCVVAGRACLYSKRVHMCLQILIPSFRSLPNPLAIFMAACSMYYTALAKQLSCPHCIYSAISTTKSISKQSPGLTIAAKNGRPAAASMINRFPVKSVCTSVYLFVCLSVGVFRDRVFIFIFNNPPLEI